MHIATTRDSDLPIFFNIDTSVGKGGQNSSQEDILLVQFLLKATAEATKPIKDDGEAKRQRALKVPVTGVADEATMDGIHAWQEARKRASPATIIDGRVDPARGVFYAKGGEWTIVGLNGILRTLLPS